MALRSVPGFRYGTFAAGESTGALLLASSRTIRAPAARALRKARRRSFAVAAAELHLTASAISHQVARLEADLGVRLFERSAHGVWLSTAGERYLARVAGALGAISAATEDLRQGVANSLYVHSAPSIAILRQLGK